MGDLQRLRGSLQNHLGRHLLDLQAETDRSRLHHAGHRHRRERRRETPATSEKTGRRPGRPAVVNEKLPSISGEAKDEETLTAETGTWKGTPTITYTYQWETCNESGGSCKNISGATSSTYKLKPTEVGSTLRVIVTAENAGGKAPATSEKSAVVVAVPPVNEKLPKISGTAEDEQTLTAENGTWRGTPTITYAYQWETCNGSGEACKYISGATSSTYKLTPSEVGSTLRVNVTAENAAGKASATSGQTAVVVAAPPVNEKLPRSRAKPRTKRPSRPNPAPGRAPRRSRTPTSGRSATASGKPAKTSRAPPPRPTD